MISLVAWSTIFTTDRPLLLSTENCNSGAKVLTWRCISSVVRFNSAALGCCCVVDFASVVDLTFIADAVSGVRLGVDDAATGRSPPAVTDEDR